MNSVPFQQLTTKESFDEEPYSLTPPCLYNLFCQLLFEVSFIDAPVLITISCAIF
jgi:hypothetical protein